MGFHQSLVFGYIPSPNHAAQRWWGNLCKVQILLFMPFLKVLLLYRQGIFQLPIFNPWSFLFVIQALTIPEFWGGSKTWHYLEHLHLFTWDHNKNFLTDSATVEELASKGLQSASIWGWLLENTAGKYWYSFVLNRWRIKSYFKYIKWKELTPKQNTHKHRYDQNVFNDTYWTFIDHQLHYEYYKD